MATNKTRLLKSPNEFFDIMDNIGDNKFVSIGYVTGANLDIPKIKRRNPETGRQKSYPDYSVFGSENEIGALVKVTSYNIRYRKRKAVSDQYKKYKEDANRIRTSFGIPEIGSRESYSQTLSWGNNGPSIYSGEREELSGHSYNPQNIHGANISSAIYAVSNDGDILQEIPKNQVVPFLKKRDIDGVSALRKIGADDATIQSYIDQIADLKFRYINFEASSILWIAATVNGEAILYINENLERIVDGISINKEDLVEIAKEKYKKALQSSTNVPQQQLSASTVGVGGQITENRYRYRKNLSEAKLSRIIRESINKVLNENYRRNQRRV